MTGRPHIVLADAAWKAGFPVANGTVDFCGSSGLWQFQILLVDRCKGEKKLRPLTEWNHAESWDVQLMATALLSWQTAVDFSLHNLLSLKVTGFTLLAVVHTFYTLFLSLHLCVCECVCLGLPGRVWCQYSLLPEMPKSGFGPLEKTSQSLVTYGRK